MINILLLEDEPHTAELLVDFLAQEADTRIVQILGSVQAAIQFFDNQQDQVDLIFMDIHLSDGIAFDIFSNVNINKPVIFCTANDKYLLDAFKSYGIAYVLKPFRESDIAAAVEKFRGLQKAFNREVQAGKVAAAKPFYPENLLVSFRNRIIPISIQNIAYLFLDNEILYLYTNKNEKYIFPKSLDRVQADLHPHLFFRINRQTLVSRLAVVSIEPLHSRKAQVHLSVQTAVPLVISRLKVPEIKRWLASTG